MEIQFYINTLYSVFSGFSLSIIFLAICNFFFKKWTRNINDKFLPIALWIIRISGLIFLVLWSCNLYIELKEDFIDTVNEYAYHAVYNRMFGPNWLVFWFEPLAYLIFTQIFWFIKVRETQWLVLNGAIVIALIPLLNIYFLLHQSQNEFLSSNYKITVVESLGIFGLDLIKDIALFSGLVALFYSVKSLKTSQ